MFITVAVACIVCGVLLLFCAKRISGKKKLRIAMAMSGAILSVSGVVLVYNLISGNIVLPLH